MDPHWPMRETHASHATGTAPVPFERHERLASRETADSHAGALATLAEWVLVRGLLAGVVLTGLWYVLAWVWRAFAEVETAFRIIRNV